MGENPEQQMQFTDLRNGEGEIPWWFSEGLHFECLGCGRCCRGEAGAVFMSPGEERRIASGLALSLEELRRRFETNRWRFPSLKERFDGSCVMHRNDNRCSIYACRPLACRTWPFWPELLSSPERWQRAARHCPGMDSGALWSGEEIAKILRSHAIYMERLSIEWGKEGH